MNAQALAQPSSDDIPDDVALGATFNVPEADLEARPLEWIERLRRVTPVWCRTFGFGKMQIPIYTVFSHDLAWQAVRHPATRQFGPELIAARGVTSGPLMTMFRNGMLTSNGDVHRRLRQPLARPFAMRAIEALRPEVAALIRDMLVAATHQPVIELSRGFARDVPGAILCRVMGVPERDIAQVNDWVHAASACLTAFRPDQLPAIEDAATQLLDYCHALLSDARARGVGGFLGDFLDATAAMDEYSEVETYVQFAGTIMAAAETTRISITMACSLLLEHEDEWKKVKQDPSLSAAAAREVLRYHPATGSLPRLVIEPIDLAGIRIPPGSILSASLLGALRDPDIFPDPNRFDIERTDGPARSIGFGGGAHRCLGEALAILEIEETVRAFTDLLPDAKLVDGPAQISGFSGTRKVSTCRIAPCP